MQLTHLVKVAAIGFAVLSAAHPGHNEEHSAEELLQKRHFHSLARRSLNSCSNSPQRRAVDIRAEARRRATVELHSKRSLRVRDTDAVLNKTHLVSSSSCGVSPLADKPTIFATNSTCILNPEGETGPYWVKGEHIRTDLRDGQPGVPIIIEAQFLNVETCEPIEGLYWDIWNCNSTGVYSGLVATGNGDTSDLSNYNATFLRGVQKTDKEGVVQFETVFPGHYSGRTTHHHVIAHLNVTVEKNNTITGGTVAHVGQIFWDQDLIYKVEATYPYNTNNITITPNADDRVFSTETESTDSDPIINYVYLGDDLSDGLFGWVTFAINVSATYDPNYSYALTEAGGIAQSGGSAETPDGTSGGPGGNGTMGAMPSGASGAPSGSAVPSGV